MKFTTRLKCILLLLFIQGIGLTRTQGQSATPALRHFTTQDGLPSSEVYSVIQDKQGNTWFGTDRGVARYNGYEFRTFTTRDGLQDNTVFKLCEDKQGRLWLLTYSGRVFYEERDKIYPYRFNDILLKNAANKVPHGFYVDSLENVFVSFRDLGILVISKEGILTWHFQIGSDPYMNYLIDEVSPQTAITAFYFPQGGRSPVETFQNLRILHRREYRTDSISFHAKSAERIVALRLTENRLLFTIGPSLYEKTSRGINFLFCFPGSVLSMMKDSEGHVWAGTETGVFHFEAGHLNSPSSRFLEKNMVTCILQDQEGGYWFTTLDNGIFYMPGHEIGGIKFSDELIQKPISLGANQDAVLFAGCWTGGLAEIRNGQVRMVYYPEKNANKMPVMNLTSLGTDDRIYLSRLSPGYYAKNKFHPLKCHIDLGLKTKLLKRADGSIYSAGSSAIFKLEHDSLISAGNIPSRINCLAETKNHQLLVGSNRGVYVFDELTGHATVFRKELDDVRVDDIQWLENNLYFATKGKGVLVLSHDSISAIDENNGLCSNLVNKLLVTGLEIWCTTNKGISHIHLTGPEKSGYTITNIRSSDGLFSDEINDITRVNDTMYVATNAGVSYFNASADFVNHTAPPVYITSLRVNNTDTMYADTMEFEHNHNNIQIAYNGISYRSEKKIIYHYQLLDGTDTISSFTTNREVEFLSLRPGRYEFRVSAMNNSGVWSRSPACFLFMIHPAWWQTIWFRIGLLLVLVFGIYLFYRNRLNKLQYQFEMERRQASLQLTAMRAQMNPHFIFNVMNSIRNYMQHHDIKSAEKYLTSFSRLVRYTLDHSDIQEVSLEEELNALRNYTELEMQRFENGFDFNIQCEEGIDLQETMLPSMLLQPFVENAIKHGIGGMKCGGQIKIDIRKQRDSILISIEDNGIGMHDSILLKTETGEKHLSHGTSITFERIKAYNIAYNRNIRARMINLNGPDGKCRGTRVELDI